MNTPIHSIHIDFTHSSEAQELCAAIGHYLNQPLSLEVETYLSNVRNQLFDAIELLEEVEV